MSDLLAGLVPEKGLHMLVERTGPSEVSVTQTHDGEWFYTVSCRKCGPWGDTYEPGTAEYVRGWHDLAHVAEDVRALQMWPERGASASVR